jgi:phosphoribosylformylglycinamidine (FGAM) synthase-like enzyme
VALVVHRFASANITEESTEELPAVQVGDTFPGKEIARSLSGSN